MAETIAVLSLKGGTGKTTTVRTLADVFRRLELDVLAIDLDPQGNLSDYFDVAPDASPTIADVLSGQAKAKAAGHDGVIPASPILAEVERSMSAASAASWCCARRSRTSARAPPRAHRLPARAGPADDQRPRPPTGRSCPPRPSTSRCRASRERSR